MINSCVVFREKIGSTESGIYADIGVHERNCQSTIGRDPDFPTSLVQLAPGCFNMGTLVHELMHLIGFHHLHLRSDRDEYLDVHNENLVDSFSAIHPASEQILTPWDYTSIMLYGAKEYSYNGEAVLVAKKNGTLLKNVREKPGLSPLDAVAIQALYKCPKAEDINFAENANLLKIMNYLSALYQMINFQKLIC